jgi:hypothetical protein
MVKEWEGVGEGVLLQCQGRKIALLKALTTRSWMAFESVSKLGRAGG